MSGRGAGGADLAAKRAARGRTRAARPGGFLRAAVATSASLSILLVSAWAAAGGAQEAPETAQEAPEAGQPDEGASPEPALAVPSHATPRKPRGNADPGLDALLHLPSGFLEGGSNTVAGAGEAEWRRRFERAQSDLDELSETLAQTKEELDSTAADSGGSQWSVAPPGGGSGGGGGPSASPLSFKLRQKLKEDRAALEEAERAMRELRIEADLAGVPADWRGEARPARPRSIAE